MPLFGSLCSDPSAQILSLGTLPLISLLSDLFRSDSSAWIHTLGSLCSVPYARIPPLESFRSDPSSRITPLGYPARIPLIRLIRLDPSTQIHPLGSLRSDTSIHIPPLGSLCWDPSTHIHQLGSLHLDPLLRFLRSDPSAYISQLESLPDIIALNCNYVRRINTLKCR